MSLTPAEQDTLERALRDAFRSEPDLRRMVRIRLGPNLSEIVVLPAKLTNIVADLVEWADTNNRVGDLITGAHASVPGNQLLAAVYADFQAGRFPSAASPGPGPAQPAPAAVTVARLTSVFPTAYSRHLTAATFPFVTVQVDNSAGSTALTVTAVALIEGRSDEAVRTVTVAAGQTEQIPLLPSAQI